MISFDGFFSEGDFSRFFFLLFGWGHSFPLVLQISDKGVMGLWTLTRMYVWHGIWHSA
ncbi:hypothetical protein COCMIDRAFT_85214 [Bipolaris oryzae ATCC 44560]|uniref:Uncharacterized protein n=1 Tax=Bipolaris oryzae ATCC 44560 TaxID=930090 RepID=W6ZGP2_COCMI|nr:uncharacterized protein COCMIDRAFT_85214 [Bipolaris oryzae ATCC 44560]EUC49185.1 hypothetical protein COCMIDRAFT_85214 [Bipolaris oryzae ATCC 44560]